MIFLLSFFDYFGTMFKSFEAKKKPKKNILNFYSIKDLIKKIREEEFGKILSRTPQFDLILYKNTTYIYTYILNMYIEFFI